MSSWPPGQRRGPHLEGRPMGGGTDLHPTSPSAPLHLPSAELSLFSTVLPAISLGSFWGVMEGRRDLGIPDG